MAYSTRIAPLGPATVLLATAIVGNACGPGTSAAEPTSGPLLTSAAEDLSAADSGPEDIRVTLEPIAIPHQVEGLEASKSELSTLASGLRRGVLEHADQVQECASGLDLQGTGDDAAFSLTLFLEVEEQGNVLGGSSAPAPGLEGDAAFAQCVLTASRSWLFPARERRGRTILIVPLVVSRQIAL